MFRGIFAALTAMVLLLVAQAAAESSDVTASGTGFFVNTNGWLVTNAHVVEGCGKVSVPSLGEASDWKIDRQKDVAAARISGANPAATIALRRSSPRLGEEVAAFGYPLACPASAPVRQNWLNEEGRISGSS